MGMVDNLVDAIRRMDELLRDGEFLCGREMGSTPRPPIVQEILAKDDDWEWKPRQLTKHGEHLKPSLVDECLGFIRDRRPHLTHAEADKADWLLSELIKIRKR